MVTDDTNVSQQEYKAVAYASNHRVTYETTTERQGYKPGWLCCGAMTWLGGRLLTRLCTRLHGRNHCRL